MRKKKFFLKFNAPDLNFVRIGIENLLNLAKYVCQKPLANVHIQVRISPFGYTTITYSKETEVVGRDNKGIISGSVITETVLPRE